MDHWLDKHLNRRCRWFIKMEKSKKKKVGRKHHCIMCPMAINLYREGLSLLNVARKLSILYTKPVDAGHVRDILVRHHEPLRTREHRAPFRWREAAIEMREQGKTLQEIGDTFQVSRERVRQVLAPFVPMGRLPASTLHKCTNLCTAVLQEAPPLSLLPLARKLGTTVGRLVTVVRHHKIETVGVHDKKHVCTEKCDLIRQRLSEGVPYQRISLELGWTRNRSIAIFRLYHPEWPWRPIGYYHGRE